MGSIHPTAKQKMFESDTYEALGLAFDAAWQKLLVSGSTLASSVYAAETREALAMRIIDLANSGERDVNRLRDDAVAFVLETLLLIEEPEEADAEEPKEALEPASRIRRTTYWVGDKPVSLVYIPALADQHPETIDYERPRR